MSNVARVGVGVFVFRNGKFLMGRRKGAHGAGSWSIPGGHLEFGEEIEETAKREVMEETGMTIDNIRFGAYTNDIFKDEDRHYITIWVVSDWVSGEPKLVEPDKFIDQQWIDYSNLPDNLFLPWDNLKKSIFFEELKKELSNSKRGTKSEV